MLANSSPEGIHLNTGGNDTTFWDVVRYTQDIIYTKHMVQSLPQSQPVVRALLLFSASQVHRREGLSTLLLKREGKAQRLDSYHSTPLCVSFTNIPEVTCLFHEIKWKRELMVAQFFYLSQSTLSLGLPGSQSDLNQRSFYHQHCLTWSLGPSPSDLQESKSNILLCEHGF